MGRDASRSGQTKGIIRGGIVRDLEKNAYYVDFRTRNKDHRKNVGVPESRIQKIENKRDNFFNIPAISTQRVHLMYLTNDSLEGNYVEPEFNKPYQIFNENGTEIYRQSIIESKEKLLEKLEKATLKEDSKE